MLFNSWEDILRVIIMSSLSYIALVILLRISGKRTLSKMNIFDFVITISLGSVFATLVLSKDVALAEGVVALSMLVMLQFIVAWLSVRSNSFERLVKGEPTLLFYRGQYLYARMRDQRIVKKEILFAMRAEGISKISDVDAVILETDGTFSVVPNVYQGIENILEGVDVP